MYVSSFDDDGSCWGSFSAAKSLRARVLLAIVRNPAAPLTIAYIRHFVRFQVVFRSKTFNIISQEWAIQNSLPFLKCLLKVLLLLLRRWALNCHHITVLDFRGWGSVTLQNYIKPEKVAEAIVIYEEIKKNVENEPDTLYFHVARKDDTFYVWEKCGFGYHW